MDPGQVLPPRPDQHVRLTNEAGCDARCDAGCDASSDAKCDARCTTGCDARCDARTVVVELTKAIQSQLVAL